MIFYPTIVVAKLVKSRARDGQSSPRLVIIGTPIRDVLLEVFCVAVVAIWQYLANIDVTMED